MMKYLVPLAIVSAFIAGCAVGPNYQKPEVGEQSVWQHADSSIFRIDSSTVLTDTTWWDLFGDTVLTGLIRYSLEENTDVRVAAARVEQLMGLYGVAKSDFFPKIGAAAGANRGQFSTSPLNASGTRVTENSFNVNVAAAWEIDLWGKIRRQSEAAKADLLASEEARRGVVLSTVSLVASSYIDLLALDRQLELTRRTAANRKLNLDLFQQRLEKGDLSQLEYDQAESEYWFAMSQIPLLEKNVTFLENAINVLLGRNPGPVQRGRMLDSLAVPEIPVGLPSSLLARRPDVAFAEEQLRSANARVGVAQAQYFPSISLTGLFGFVSGELSSLFSPETRVWNVGANALQPIFRGGEIRGQVEAAEGVKKEALYSYVNAVHSAFSDAEDALVDRTKTAEQASAEGKRVAALTGYLDLANSRYTEGVTSYLEVLDADRNLYSSDLEYTLTKAAVYKSVISVYRALAGGWLDRASATSFQVTDSPGRREK